MTRHIHVTLDDDDFSLAKAGKGGRTWEEAIMDDIAVDSEHAEGEQWD